MIGLDPPCPCGPDAPDEACPYHGRSPWAVCGQCDAGGHTCPGCGDYLEHDGPGVCASCMKDLEEAR